MPPGDLFGDMMNAPAKYVVSKTLEKPKWRNTTVIRGDVVEAVRDLKAQPGKNILTDGSSQLVPTLLKNDLRRGLDDLLKDAPARPGTPLGEPGSRSLPRQTHQRILAAFSRGAMTVSRPL